MSLIFQKRVFFSLNVRSLGKRVHLNTGSQCFQEKGLFLAVLTQFEF